MVKINGESSIFCGFALAKDNKYHGETSFITKK